VLTVPSGTQVVRFLPALNLRREDAAEGLALIAGVVKAIA
jgi:acetylornithine/succinyldiaminopimelate/putrescine aminotransferase